VRFFRSPRLDRVLAPFRGHFFAPALVLGLTIVFGLATRVVLSIHDPAPIDAGGLLGSFAVGSGFDILVGVYFALPLTLWLAVVPPRLARTAVHRWALVIVIASYTYLLLLLAASEWVFWDEFGARFNFIAVDYLIYTREVLGNILESYPVGTVLGLIAAGALLVSGGLARPLWRRAQLRCGTRARTAVAAGMLAAAALLTACVSADTRPEFEHEAARELSGNGIYQFFAAFRHSSIDYPSFYATLPAAEARAMVHESFALAREHVPASPNSDFERVVIDRGAERRLNVVLISVESLGADFVGRYGDPRGLTPNLDRLAKDSLVFTDVFATGNRTVRGLEALSLSIPPTPGEAILKRPGASDLFTLGSVFQERGYDALYLYGGYGYFDNMNKFFSANGYRTVDRRSIAKEKIHHETIWGVADEDLFDLALEQLDEVRAAGKPFFAHVMTTSNHRPYTYPQDRIDIASGSGREGAVKYTDYALGRFMEQAKRHAWFDDTLFVITADHGANARGTLEIPVEQYRIPLYFYSPAHLKPGVVRRLMSQIDIGPTILGRLNFSYRTKFFGRDLFRTRPGQERAFVANYQALGYMRAGRLVTLAPHRVVKMTTLKPQDVLASGVSDEELRREAISWYQMAYETYVSGDYDDDDANTHPATAAVVNAGDRAASGAIIPAGSRPIRSLD
jgi:phosphoglycerol transferase MdoB-like AlkP superfamily enzyme